MGSSTSKHSSSGWGLRPATAPTPALVLPLPMVPDCDMGQDVSREDKYTYTKCVGEIMEMMRVLRRGAVHLHHLSDLRHTRERLMRCGTHCVTAIFGVVYSCCGVFEGASDLSIAQWGREEDQQRFKVLSPWKHPQGHPQLVPCMAFVLLLSFPEIVAGNRGGGSAVSNLVVRLRDKDAQ